MNPKSFSNSFLGTFIFTLALLCVAGISSINVMAQKSDALTATSTITVNKRFCDSIGASNVCNGRPEYNGNPNAQGYGTVTFDVYAGATAGTPASAPIVVDIRQGDRSQGTETTDSIYTTGSQYTVCERVPDGYTSLPRPDNSSGGVTQTANGSCITGRLVSGNNVFQFLNYPTLTPTAAPAMLSGRIRDTNGKPAAHVFVEVTNLISGEVLTAQTNLFGRYIFEDLPTGEGYQIRVYSRRYTFSPDTKVIDSLMEDLTNADFVARQRGGGIELNP